MTCICSICREGLETPVGPQPLNSRTCSTRCGHVFHVRCLNTWWKNLVPDYPERVTNNMHTQIEELTCPFCGRISVGPLVMLLYPSFTGEPETSLQQRTTALELEVAKQNTEILALKTQVEQFRARQTSSQSAFQDPQPEAQRRGNERQDLSSNSSEISVILEVDNQNGPCHARGDRRASQRIADKRGKNFSKR